MLDFAVLPPEITSARMYSGPGSGPMMVAASAWDALTGQLHTSALGYSSVLSELQDQNWAGPASQAMAAAAAPFVAWLTATATLTEQAAGQVRAAAAAYETAHAATVPPTVVAANRTQLATLAATNFLGQNTTMIAATEAAYADMWAQDAAAMYGYATSSSAAAQLAPFRDPPQTTNAVGQSAQTAAAAQATGAAITQNTGAALSQGTSAATPSTPTSLADEAMNGISSLNTLTGPANFGAQISRTISNGGSFLIAAAKALGSAAPKLPAVPSLGAAALSSANGVLARDAVLASVGKAAPVGALSVPQAWADATPVAAAAEEPMWLSEEELAAASSWEAAAPETSMMGAAPAAMMGSMAGAAARSSVSSILRVGARRFNMPRPALGG